MNRRKYPRALLSALVLCLLAGAAMLVSPAASGQKGDRVSQEIGQALTSFETVALDPSEVLRSVREEGSVTLQTARGPFDLVVEPFDVRSDDYRAAATGPDGQMVELPRTPSNSWRGHVRGQEDTTVRLYLDGLKVQGIIITPGGTFFVEPARDLSAAAGAEDFLFYSSSDVKPTDGSCEEVTLAGKVAKEAAPAALTAIRPAEAFAPKPVVRVATEADFEFYQLDGSNVAATNNDILNIMTQVDGIYDAQLGVRVNVVFQHVWATSNDPYTLTNASAALDQLADNFDSQFGTGTVPSRDLVHMFTGKNLDDTTIGIAYTGALCDFPALSFAISESKHKNEQNGVELSAAERVTLTAHEIGHNLGASHTAPGGSVGDPPAQITGCNAPNASIMQPAVTNSTGFCQFSRDQITSHLTGSGGSCLARQTQAGCTYALNASSVFFPASGGAGSVGVTAGAGCAWGVAEGADWLDTGVLAGSGPGNVPYTVAANNRAPHETIVDIGGQKLIVKQAGSAGCGATPLVIGQTVNGSLSSNDCRVGQTGRADAFVDLYTFTARAGQRVRVEMKAAIQPVTDPPPAAALDTFLYLLGPDGGIVNRNDDIIPLEDSDSRIPVNGFYTLPATGVYTIEATSFGDNDGGDYTLTLSDNSAADSFSFSTSAYNVDEGTGGGGLGVDGAGFRVITVSRSGTASEINAGTATVDYATADGTASRQKDYTQALGTLVFGPGETSKTFTVFVDDDAFQEGAETVQLTLSNPVGATLAGIQTATLTINSNDAASGPSPVRAASFNGAFFVRQQYLDFLNREPDTSGFQFWQGNITECGSDEPCKEVKRINVSAAFFLSIEFQNTGYLVYRTYKAAYGDANSPNVPGTVPVIRLNEFLPDTQRIGRNVVVGQPGWEQALEANKQAYALEFVLRPRFLSAFPLTMTPAQFVDKLVQNAGITLTTGERDALVAQFNTTGDVSAVRAALLRAVAENQQLQDNEKRRAFVLMEYYGYLRRDPDTGPNADFTGWKFWLDKLNEFNGDYIAAEMVKAFIQSDEYINRFGN